MSPEDRAVDLRQSQHRAVSALVNILDEAESRELPALPWMVSALGARLRATSPIGSPDQVRRALEAWSAYLDAVVTRVEKPTGTEVVTLTARRGDVDVVLTFMVSPGCCRECGDQVDVHLCPDHSAERPHHQSTDEACEEGQTR